MIWRPWLQQKYREWRWKTPSQRFPLDSVETAERRLQAIPSGRRLNCQFWYPVYSPQLASATHYKRVPHFQIGSSVRENLTKGTSSMHSTKYIGMDMHKEATTIAVLDASGKSVTSW
jgi:hypothetical protein